MKNQRITCIVAAAGRGMRFDRETPKSFYPIEGRTLLGWSLAALAAWGRIDSFIIVVPKGWEDKAREVAERNTSGAPFTVFPGGETRQESVGIGLRTVEEADLVMVHDAARPVISRALIERVAQAAIESGAAVPAFQVTDTLGRLRDEGLEAIVPRERLIGIQTPQVFRLDVLKKAYEAADETIRKSTDESSLVLSSSHPVRAVDGERWNIKVTVKEDLEIVEGFLLGRKIELPEAGKC